MKIHAHLYFIILVVFLSILLKAFAEFLIGDFSSIISYFRSVIIALFTSSGILIFWDYRIRKIRRENKQNKNFSTESFILPLTISKVFDLCRNSVCTIKNSIVSRQNEPAGTIEIKIKDSFNFQTCNVIFNLEKKGDFMTEVKITAYPRFKIQQVIPFQYLLEIKILKDIKSYLFEKTGEIKNKILQENQSAFDEFAEANFEKEKVEVKNANHF